MLAVIALMMTNSKKYKHSYLTKLTTPLGMENQQAGDDREEAVLTVRERIITKTPDVREGLPQPCSSGPAAGLASRPPHTDTSPVFLFLPGTGSG